MCRASCPHRVFLFRFRVRRGAGATVRRTGRGRRRPRGRELRLASALSVHTACGLFAIKSGNINDVQVGSALQLQRSRDLRHKPIHPVHPRPRSVTNYIEPIRRYRPGGRRPGAPREQRRERRESQTNDMSSTSCDLCVPAHGWASGPPVRRRATGAAASATRPSKDSRSTYRQRVNDRYRHRVNDRYTTLHGSSTPT